MGRRIVDWVESHRPLFFVAVAVAVVGTVLVVNLLRDEGDDLDHALRGCRLLAGAYGLDDPLLRESATRLAGNAFEEFEQADERYPRRLAARVFTGDAPLGIGQRLGEWCVAHHPEERYSPDDFRP